MSHFHRAEHLSNCVLSEKVTHQWIKHVAFQMARLVMATRFAQTLSRSASDLCFCEWNCTFFYTPSYAVFNSLEESIKVLVSENAWFKRYLNVKFVKLWVYDELHKIKVTISFEPVVSPPKYLDTFLQRTKKYTEWL